MESGWVPLLMGQYCPHSGSEGVEFNDEWEVRIGMDEEWGASEGLFEGGESL